MTDSKQKEPSEKFAIRGVAVFPKVNTPDTKWKAEGQYTAKTRMEEQLDEALIIKLTEMRDNKFDEVVEGINDKSIFPKLNPKERAAKLAALKKGDIGATPETDKEGEETGYFVINPKMTASGVSKKTGKPWTRTLKFFDAKGKLIKEAPKVFGGTEWKVAVEAKAYFAPGTKDAPPVVGVTFYLEGGIQILKLVKAGDRSASSFGFGEEEGGYEAEDEQEETFGGSSGDDTDSGGAKPAAGEDF